MKLPPQGQWCVYILECKDGTYYTGSTNDLTRRLDEHNSGKGAKYTRSRTPVKLLGWAPEDIRSSAQYLEARVKAQPRDRKRDTAHFWTQRNDPPPPPPKKPKKPEMTEAEVRDEVSKRRSRLMLSLLGDCKTKEKATEIARDCTYLATVYNMAMPHLPSEKDLDSEVPR